MHKQGEGSSTVLYSDHAFLGVFILRETDTCTCKLQGPHLAGYDGCVEK